CGVLCDCRCHKVSKFGSWKLSLLQCVAGTIVMSYSGISLLSKTCDRNHCISGHRGEVSIKFTYIFPSWLMNAALAMTYGNDTGSPELNLRIIHTVPCYRADIEDALFIAVYEGDAENVKRVINNRLGSIYDIAEGFHITALGLAVNMLNLDVVQVLLQAGADPYQSHGSGNPPIGVAFTQFITGREGAERLKEFFSFSNFLEEDDYSNLQRFLLENSVTNTQEFLQKPGIAVQVGHKSRGGHTALHLAAARGSREVTETLLLLGADKEARTNTGMTPLHAACSGGHYDVAKALIDAGASVHARVYGKTPLFQAAMGNNSMRVMELLLQNGADINAQDDEGSTVLNKAILYDGGTNVAYLVDQGVNIDHRQLHGDTALVDGVTFNKHRSVNILLDRGADYRMIGRDQSNILHVLAATGDVEMMAILTRAQLWGLDIAKKDARGRTPFQLLNERFDICQELREAFQSLLASL
ncbi:ankyrin, partial [Thozetella sp. PMI_491]